MADVVQDNHSRSSRGRIRAFHLQADPGQANLVRVAHGRASDVVADIMRSSPTFREWEAFELDDDRHLQLNFPVGFRPPASSQTTISHVKVRRHPHSREDSRG